MSLALALETPRLRIVPVTRTLSDAAAQGYAALERALGAGIDPGWREDHVFERARIAVDDRPRYALVVHREDARLIGEVRMEPLRGRDGYEIGYAIVPGYRRRGFAVEATGAVIAALEAGGADLIVAGCDMNNVASVRTLRRLGFTLDGSSARSRAFWWVRLPGAG